MENLILEYKNLASLKQENWYSYYLKRIELIKRLIDEYELVGFKIVFEQEYNEIFSETIFHEKVPEQFAWPHNFSKLPRENINKIFKCLTVECDGAVSKLKRACEKIFPITISGKDYLVYYLKIKENDTLLHPKFLIGGAPLKQHMITDSNFNLPEDLWDFYSMHNGFGVLDQWNIFGSPLIKPYNMLEIEPFWIENTNHTDKPSVTIANDDGTFWSIYILNGKKVLQQIILYRDEPNLHNMKGVFEVLGKVMDAAVLD